MEQQVCFDFGNKEVWLRDALTAALLERLQSGAVVESREYLKPIFRWMKPAGKSYNVNKAFDFADWMIHITTSNCESLGISTQPHLSPQYAYNTLITMSQRGSDAASALRAFNCLKRHSFSPDVFSYTALLDVVGRKSNLGIVQALEIYDEMLTSRNYPNIVTQVTMMRLVGMPHNTAPHINGEAIVLKLLADARMLASPSSTDTKYTHQSQQIHLDISIYDNALAATVRLKNMKLAQTILSMLKADGVAFDDITYRILGKLAYVLGSDVESRQAVVSRLVDAGLLDSQQQEIVLVKLQERYSFVAGKKLGGSNAATGPVFAGLYHEMT